MSVVLVMPGREGRVELPNEPLLLARSVLGELVDTRELPAAVGRESDSGWRYAPTDVPQMIRALERALEVLAEVLDPEGHPRRATKTAAKSYFNERQYLRAALALFQRAARESLAVEVHV